MSVAPKFKYVAVRNEDGKVRRDVYLAVLAYADSLQTQVCGFKERLSTAKTELKQAQSETKRSGRRNVGLFLVGVLCGAFLAGLLIFRFSR